MGKCYHAVQWLASQTFYLYSPFYYTAIICTEKARVSYKCIDRDVKNVLLCTSSALNYWTWCTEENVHAPAHWSCTDMQIISSRNLCICNLCRHAQLTYRYSVYTWSLPTGVFFFLWNVYSCVWLNGIAKIKIKKFYYFRVSTFG